MAHFAQLDENNIVLQVIVVSNDDIMDDEHESEAKGIEFCQSLLGSDTKWVQTSYNDNFRKRYAGIGYTFDSEKDVFIPPKPYNSWILDEEEYKWNPPIDFPNDPDENNVYIWNEEIQNWSKL